jgi:hypothetical protein
VCQLVSPAQCGERFSILPWTARKQTNQAVVVAYKKIFKSTDDMFVFIFCFNGLCIWQYNVDY